MEIGKVAGASKNSSSINGGLAQLARAFAWHAKGHRFDSGNLHLTGAIEGRQGCPAFIFEALPGHTNAWKHQF